MKIGIVGSQGFVGNALKELFKLNDDIEIIEYDKGIKTNYPVGSIEAIAEAEIVFICLPTPMKEDGSCDVSIVEDVVTKLDNDLIVIKSTIPIGTTEKLRDLTGKSIVHNPEFLREATAVEDMINADRTVIGADDPSEAVKLVKLYEKVYKDMTYKIVPSKVSELSKYAINAFLATKVAYFNTISDIANSYDIDYDLVRETVLLDKRIGLSHTQVIDGGGFGGHCLPKDINALIDIGRMAGSNVRVLENVWIYNGEVKGGNDG